MRTGSLMLRRSQRGGNAREWISSALMSFGLLLTVLSVPSTAAGFSLFGPNLDPVKDLLDDPYSAKFENVKTLPSGIVCGAVNSKNSYGAYTGKKMFAIAEGRAYLEEKSGMETSILCVETRNCEDMKCVHEAVDKRLAEEEERAFAPRIQMVGERLAYLCFSGLPDKSDAQRECLGTLSVCREESSPSKHLKCLVDAYEQRSKKSDTRGLGYTSSGYP